MYFDMLFMGDINNFEKGTYQGTETIEIDNAPIQEIQESTLDKIIINNILLYYDNILKNIQNYMN